MRVRFGLFAAAALVTLVGLAPIRADLPPAPFKLRAFAVNMTNVNVPRGNAGVLEIRITGWSSAETRKRLIQLVLDKGQDALLSALQKEPVKGRLSMPNWQGPDPQNYRLGWDIRYAAQSKLPDGGDRIVILTDRQMSMWEVRERPRTYDYPFVLMEIRLPKEGKGEGRAFGATQIKFDKKQNQMVLEQYSAGEIRLNEVEVIK
ncbi:MAG TPA: hypothetical protein VGI12_06170 [Vicinamibacterales bacterium]|jgi:hypothetical protein